LYAGLTNKPVWMRKYKIQKGTNAVEFQTLWRLCQKRVVRTKLDIYVFIPICVWKQ
jgi:hypothetical protein